MIPEGTKTCTGPCGLELDNRCFSFYKTRFLKDGTRLRVNTICRKCQKQYSQEVADLKQTCAIPKPPDGFPCACCEEPTVNFEFDHDHRLKRFRGWTCKDCNVGFGKLGDDWQGIFQAFKYMHKTGTPEQRAEMWEAMSEFLIANQPGIP